MYDHRSQLSALLVQALATPPLPIPPKEQYLLSWEAATERLLDAAALPEGTRRPRERPLHAAAYALHNALGSTDSAADFFREGSGATPASALSPERMAALEAGGASS